MITSPRLCTFAFVSLLVLHVHGQQPQYLWSNFAGTQGSSGSPDGAASAARFSLPAGMAVDSSGNVYVVDEANNTVREISGGTVSTLAGTAGTRGSTNGTGAAARFSFPRGAAVDSSGNVYVSDTSNFTIRKIAPGGVVTTFAGIAGLAGTTDGMGSAARFSSPQGIGIDSSGNLYVADAGAATIRKITPAGLVSTFAGTANSFGSTDGTGSAARFEEPVGVTVDGSGNIYVTDTAFETIRKITSGAVVTTLAGKAGSSGSADGIGAAARFNEPIGIVSDAGGNLYVADAGNNTIRKVTPTGVVTTVAGTVLIAGCADGTGTAAQFAVPTFLAMDSSGNLYISDADNNTIREMTSAGVVTTLAGLGGIGNTDAASSAAHFFYPRGVAVDGSGNLYVADQSNQTIRKITSSGTVTTLAGGIQVAGNVNGTGSAARFSSPAGLATDSSGNVYVADSQNAAIRKVTPAGLVTTFASGLGNPLGVAVDSSGNVYVADNGSNVIRKITPGGSMSILAGGLNLSGTTDGMGTAARFNGPSAVAVDSSGNVYVADTFNSTIRAITPGGLVSTLAGSAGLSGNTDGMGSAARFKNPIGLTIDSSGNLYVCDPQNFAIRMVTSAGAVSTIGGGTQGDANGVGNVARFSSPEGIAINSSGTLYVADFSDNHIFQGFVPPPNPVIVVQEPLGATLTSGSSLVDFGSVLDGQNAVLTFTIMNAGSQNLTLGSVTADGTNGMEFAPGNPGTTVTPGNTATFTVTFTPQGLGLRTAMLHIPSNDPNTSTFNVSLQGTETLALTGAATTVQAGFATLNGLVNPNGAATTSYFQYGTTTNYGSTTPAINAGNGNAIVPTLYNLFGLTKSTPYHYRLVVVSNGITYFGADQTFTTPASSGPSWHSGQVSALTDPTMNNMADGARTGVADTSRVQYWYKGTDSNIWVVWLNGSNWAQTRLSNDGNVSDWLTFGGQYNLLCYVGKDNQIWCVSWDGTKWVTAQLGVVPGGTTIAGDVAIDNSWNTVYFRGTDNMLHALAWNGKTWVYSTIGTNANIKSNLTVDEKNHLVYYQGADNQLWTFQWTGTQWVQYALTTTANVGGALSVDVLGLTVYYRSSTDNSAGCVYWSGKAWVQESLVASANINASATSFSDTAPYTSQYNNLYIDGNNQAEVFWFNGSAWTHGLLGDGSAGLTGGLSLQPVYHWIFARRSDGNIIIFYYQ